MSDPTISSSNPAAPETPRADGHPPIPPSSASSLVAPPQSPIANQDSQIPSRTLINRANSRKSTGPRTELGKYRVSRNALKHGLKAAIHLPHLCQINAAHSSECNATYRTFAREIEENLHPRTAIQRTISWHLTDLLWRIQRLPEAERQLFTIEAVRQQSDPDPDPALGMPSTSSALPPNLAAPRPNSTPPDPELHPNPNPTSNASPHQEYPDPSLTPVSQTLANAFADEPFRNSLTTFLDYQRQLYSLFLHFHRLYNREVKFRPITPSED